MDKIAQELVPFLKKLGIEYYESDNAIRVPLPYSFGELEIAGLCDGSASNNIVTLVGYDLHWHGDLLNYSEAATDAEAISVFIKDIMDGNVFLIEEFENGKSTLKTIEADLEAYYSCLPENKKTKIYNLKIDKGQFPEIISVRESDGKFFLRIRKVINNNSRTFEFEVDKEAYSYLKEILGLKIFDKTPESKYQYHFVLATAKFDNPDIKIGLIHIAQGDNADNIVFELPKTVTSNLKWFLELDDFEKANHLKEIKKLNS
jgi:hypothetical protein